MTSRRAAIYVRISSDPSGERLGVTRQLEACRAKAASLDWAVAGIYEDNDVSASSKKPRPAYQRMLTDLAAGKVGAVVVWDLDRLTRRPVEIEAFIDLADSHGVALASVGGDVDLATDNGRLFARIKGAVARAEVERKSARQKAANTQRALASQPALFCRLSCPSQTRRGTAGDTTSPQGPTRATASPAPSCPAQQCR